jgi:16S rRNA (adenine1518-N6/adenine1519-N6)-dimethyltransferase
VIAIEVDPVLAEYLRAKHRDDSRLAIIEGDILKANLSQWGPATVAGNLPYYITSPIVEKVLSLRSAVHRAVFLVQKEVAERMTTGPGSREYGYLSVATQFLADAEILFTIPPGAFKPPPKVDSAVVRLIPRETLASTDVSGFLRFAQMCFRQKRKMLRNNLGFFYPEIHHRPEATKRAEHLSVSELLGLFEDLTKARDART